MVSCGGGWWWLVEGELGVFVRVFKNASAFSSLTFPPSSSTYFYYYYERILGIHIRMCWTRIFSSFISNNQHCHPIWFNFWANCCRLFILSLLFFSFPFFLSRFSPFPSPFSSFFFFFFKPISLYFERFLYC